MSNEENSFFGPNEIEKFKSNLKNSSDTYIITDNGADRTDDFCMISFLGRHNGNEVVINASIYTLKLFYHSELYEIAEAKIIEKFPQYEKWITDSAGTEDVIPESVEDEINTYLTEVILDIEEEDEFKVEEHADLVEEEDGTLLLDAGLHLETITDDVLGDLVKEYNAGTLELDETAYSFETEFDESEED